MLSKKWANFIPFIQKETITTSFLFLTLCYSFSGVSAQTLQEQSNNATCTSCKDGTQCCPPDDVCIPSDENGGYDCSTAEEEREILYALGVAFLLIVSCALLYGCYKTIKHLENHSSLFFNLNMTTEESSTPLIPKKTPEQVGLVCT